MSKTSNCNRQIKEGLPFFKKQPLVTYPPTRWCEQCGARLRRTRSYSDTLCSPCEEARPVDPADLHPAPAPVDEKRLCKLCGERPTIVFTGIYAYHCGDCREAARERAGVGRRVA